MTRIGVSIPEMLLEQLDQSRGDIPRSRAIARAIEQKLGIPSQIGDVENE